jgi:hypothetical protein
VDVNAEAPIADSPAAAGGGGCPSCVAAARIVPIIEIGHGGADRDGDDQLLHHREQGRPRSC